MNNKSNTYEGALQGLNVLDFGHYYSGPMAAMMLADQGANVIHVVQPKKNEQTSEQFRLLNRNKKVLVLDLKDNDGKKKAKELIQNSDVLIENFRPGVMDRLGLGYSDVKPLNSRIIYLSIPGFASTDIERSKIQAWEGVVAAAAGLFTSPSWWRGFLKYPPLYYSIPQCSVYGAMHGVLAILSALIARERFGEGTVIEVPLVEAALSGFALAMPQEPESVPQVPKHWEYLVYDPDDSQEEQSRKHFAAMNAFTSSAFTAFYTCADGRKLHINCNYNRKFIKRTLEILGIYKSLRNKGFSLESPLIFGLTNDMAHFDKLDQEKAEYLRTCVEGAFLKKSAHEWEALLSEVTTVSMVRTTAEWLALEPMLRSGVVVEMGEDEEAIKVPGSLGDIYSPDQGFIKTKPEEPQIYDFEILLDEFKKSFASSVIGKGEPKPFKKGDMLSGVKILDLCNVVAGPSSTYNLAQYGAEVIKADPPGDSHFYAAQLEFMEITQGKRSILTDLKTAPGRDVFERLVKWADVVVHNSLDDIAYRLGITQKQLEKINPNIITNQLSAFGGVYPGGWEMRPGNDSVAQAPIGLMAHFGSLDNPQIVGGYAPTDMMGGLALSITTLLNLYQKRKTGVAGEGRTSLARAINHLQLPHLILKNGELSVEEPGGQFTKGPSSWQRIYECADGWIYVHFESKQSLDSFLEPMLKSGDVDDIEKAFKTNKCAHWLDKLELTGVPGHKVVSLRDIAKQNLKTDNNHSEELSIEKCDALVIRRMLHPRGQAQIYLNPKWVRIGEEHSYYRLAIGPRPGEHTTQILSELGFSNTEIERLIEKNICHEYLPALGDKSLYCFTPEQQK